jgi:hypothetical protein
MALTSLFLHFRDVINSAAVAAAAAAAASSY